MAIFGFQTEIEKNELAGKLMGNKLQTGEADSLTKFTLLLFGMAYSGIPVHTQEKIQSLVTVTAVRI